MGGYKAYQGNEINTSSPLGLILLSYDALYKSLARAEHAINGGDLSAEADHTSRALEALIDLSSSLNMELGGDVAQDLANLYAYMMQRLSQGMCSCSTDAVEEVMKLVTTLREGWEALSPERQAQRSVQQPMPSVAAANMNRAAAPQMAMSYAG